MTSFAPDIHEKAAGETRIVSIDWTGELSNGDTLVGTPAIVSISGDAVLTAGAVAVNSSVIIVNSASVAVGCGTTFLAAAGTTGTLYSVIVSSSTVFGQTLYCGVKIQVT